MLFTILHIVANYRAVKAVKMRTLNRTRFLIVLQHFFKSREAPSVEETNRAEPVVMGRIPTGNLFLELVFKKIFCSVTLSLT